MKPFTLFTVPSGQTYAVPTEIIASNRAANYVHEFDGSLERSLEEDTKPLFTEDPFEIADWAKNNMNWSDLSASAVLVAEEVKRPDELYMEATVEAADDLPAPTPLNGETLIYTSLERVLNQMYLENSQVGVIVLDHPSADRSNAFLSIRGTKAEVHGALTAVQTYGEALAAAKTAQAAQATGSLILTDSTTPN